MRFMHIDHYQFKKSYNKDELQFMQSFNGGIMVGSLRRKLTDQSGASLMVALLFFIICAVVGSSILAAASSSMGRLKNIYETDQQRNTLSSAANLIAEKFGQEYDFSDFDDTSEITVDTENKELIISTLDNNVPNRPEQKTFNINSFTNITSKLAYSYIFDNWSRITSEWNDDENSQKYVGNRTITDYGNREPDVEKLDYKGDPIIPVSNQLPSFVLTLSENINDQEETAVDIYYDKNNMDIEIHIYPYRQGSQDSFDNSTQRYLIKIPAKSGNIQFIQTADTNSDGTVTTVRKNMIISDFGWEKAEIYTGASVDVERDVYE